jgi:hypothetical protein
MKSSDHWLQWLLGVDHLNPANINGSSHCVLLDGEKQQKTSHPVIHDFFGPA